MKSIKDNVVVKGLQPEIILAYMIASEVFKSVGVVDCIITSGTEGKHKQGSKHYSGNAIDLRTRNFPEGGSSSTFVDVVCHRLSNALTADYDIVKEATHIHLEFDPKDK